MGKIRFSNERWFETKQRRVSTPGGETMSKKVLIVDDEEMMRKFLSIQLPKFGYEVKEASDGMQALERLADEDFNLILLDILMPTMDGWQILGKIRENPRTKFIPVIVLSGKQEDSDILKGYELGASYYIIKPFDAFELLRAIQMIEEGTVSEPKNCFERIQECSDTEKQISKDFDHRRRPDPCRGI
jgi:CheY-like chemotaxis protein